MLALGKVLSGGKFSRFSAGRWFGRARRIKTIKNQWMSAEQHCINLGRLRTRQKKIIFYRSGYSIWLGAYQWIMKEAAENLLCALIRDLSYGSLWDPLVCSWGGLQRISKGFHVSAVCAKGKKWGWKKRLLWDRAQCLDMISCYSGWWHFMWDQILTVFWSFHCNSSRSTSRVRKGPRWMWNFAWLKSAKHNPCPCICSDIISLWNFGAGRL